MLSVILFTRARSADNKGVKWIARMPPKRQVEGSNPSEPVLYRGSYTCMLQY